jgi:hypothetical protein
MNQDAELDLFRAQVNCAAVLENMGQPWRLDKVESTRRALKYRRAKDEVLIIIHDGRGWFDPLSTAQGDIFKLVQHLDPNLNFGHVRKILRRFVGIAPHYIPAEPRRKGQGTDQPVAARWDKRPRLRPGCPAWSYLLDVRGLPPDVLFAAAEQDCIRDGAFKSAWFAHRDQGMVTQVEVRGPDFKGSLRAGHKTLFRFRFYNAEVTRLVIAEAPIDALSIAALEGNRQETLYVATGGGMGPCTIAALQMVCADLKERSGASVESAADANLAGDRYAERHAEIAQNCGVPFRRLRPPDGLDWNNVLQNRRSA